MKQYIALSKINLLLTLRDRAAVFFSYVFPLLFFFVFTEGMDAEKGGTIVYAVTFVLILGIVGTGLFGAGVRAVQERELNILRRFKVAPISPVPILTASIVTGWLLFLPMVFLTVGLACFLYGMPVPERWLSLLALVSLGVVAFRAIGLIVASVVNTSQENAVVTNILYLPMLLLTGATIPLNVLPRWLQIIGHFLPASYMTTGIQGILLRNENLADHFSAVVSLALTTVLAVFISMKLFRWEKEQKIPASGKLWLAVILLPFIVLGSWEAYTRENITKATLFFREQRRGRTLLIRDARIFTGDGKVIERGAVLIKGGKIQELYEGPAPDPDMLNADPVEAAGKTVLPGLIDAHVHLALPGGFYEPPSSYKPDEAARRALAACLYSGVTSVRSAGDPLDLLERLRSSLESGEWLGADLHFSIRRQPVPQQPYESARAAEDIAAAVAAGVDPIEHAPFHEILAQRTFEEMARRDIAFIPALSAVEALSHLTGGNTPLLDRSLVQQVGPRELIDATRRALQSSKAAEIRDRLPPFDLEVALENLRRARDSGVTLVAGSDAGNLLVIHGPAVHRELQLWVESGIPPKVALQAATYNAARLLKAGDRIGLVRKGHDADLLIVDGNPLEDIAATERISVVIFKGERITRLELFRQE